MDAGVEEPAADAGSEDVDVGSTEEPPSDTGASSSDPADQTMRGGCTSAPGLLPIAALALRRRRHVS